MVLTEINETFTGADGSSPANWVAGYTGTGGSATIQGNAFRLRTVGGTNYIGTSKVTRRYIDNAISDFDEIIEVWNGDATEKYFDFNYRADNVLDGATGYTIRLTQSNAKLYLVTNYNFTELAQASFTPPAVGTHYWCRAQVVGGTHKFKFWTGSKANQPMTGGVDGSGWQISISNENTYASGAWGFASLIGAASATRDFFVDNIEAVPEQTNQSPTVSAGADKTINPNESRDTLFIVTATSADPDGTITSLVWEDITGTPEIVSGSGNTRIITFSRTAQTVVKTFRVTVTDNGGLTATDTVIVTILPHKRWLKTSGDLVPLIANPSEQVGQIFGQYDLGVYDNVVYG